MRLLAAFCAASIGWRRLASSHSLAHLRPAASLASPIRGLKTMAAPSGFVDAHAHLFHEQFAGEEDAIANKCKDFGLDFVIVNGLDPATNRVTLDMCARHPHLLPALGIYPLDAACNVITDWPHPFPPPERFNIEEEVQFIDQMAAEGKIVAVGECGLDKHYLTDDVSMAEQERVLRLLIEVAKRRDLPLILHTRKAEARTFEILQEMGVTKADFHCFCGKAKLARKIADAGYYLSIPSAVERHPNFQGIVREVPLEQLLTETDSPYMGPDKGQRNDPSTVPRGVAAIARVKGISEEEARNAIRANFQRLFGR